MPEMRMNSSKSRAINCGPLSEIMRDFTSGYFSLARSRITSTSALAVDGALVAAKEDGDFLLGIKSLMVCDLGCPPPCREVSGSVGFWLLPGRGTATDYTAQ